MAVAKPVVKAPVKAPAPVPVKASVSAQQQAAAQAAAQKAQAQQQAALAAQQKAAALAAQQKIQAQQQAAAQAAAQRAAAEKAARAQAEAQRVAQIQAQQAQAAKLQQQRTAQQQQKVAAIQQQLAPKPAPAPVQQPVQAKPAPNPFQGYTQPAQTPTQLPPDVIGPVQVGNHIAAVWDTSTGEVRDNAGNIIGYRDQQGNPAPTPTPTPAPVQQPGPGAVQTPPPSVAYSDPIAINGIPVGINSGYMPTETYRYTLGVNSDDWKSDATKMGIYNELAKQGYDVSNPWTSLNTMFQANLTPEQYQKLAGDQRFQFVERPPEDLGIFPTLTSSNYNQFGGAPAQGLAALANPVAPATTSAYATPFKG